MKRLTVVLLLLAACANQKNPVTGKSYYSPIGNDFAAQDNYVRENYLTQLSIAQDSGLLPEPEIVAACQKVFDDLVAAIPAPHRRGYRYFFYVSASPEVNAYTYGGGRVHCHLGLVAHCEDAAEFAGIIGHEIAHVSHDHVGQSLGRQRIVRRIFQPGTIVGLPGLRITGALGNVVLIQHTRRAEREADDLAVDYTLDAGYDPDGVARFFDRMEEQRSGLGVLRTHPYPENRVRDIRKRIEAKGGGPQDAIRTTGAFKRAQERARNILPHYEALYEALSQDDIEEVLIVADKGIAALPGHPQFHFWRGIVLDRQAMDLREKKNAKEPPPDPPEVRALHEQATAALRRADELDDTNALIPLFHAIIALQSQVFAEAEIAATATIEIVPAPLAYYVRGLARYVLGKKEEAFEDFDTFLPQLPRYQRREVLEQIREVAPDYEPKRA